MTIFPEPANVVRLLVNGREFGGWKSVRISAGIERQARDFALEVTDRWPGQTDVPRRIRAFDACQVYIGNDLVLTGWVDGTPIKHDAKSVTVGVKGRSKTADLVDCCPIEPGQSTKSGSGGGSWGDVVGPDGKTAKVVAPPTKTASQWRNAKMETIAAALAAPYSVRVIAETDTGKAIPDHQVQQGETVFESIDRMMRLRHVLSTDNERGDLVFIDVGSAGKAATAIEVGPNGNAESGDAPLDYKGVFSQYIVKGQRAGNDAEFGGDVSEEQGSSDEDLGAVAGSIETEDAASASDSRSKRRRVLVIKQSGHADEGTCSDRALYEKAHRAAKALETTYVVNGWRQQDGSLWRPNQIVRVRDPIVGFDADMVVAEVSWILDKDGLRSEIRVGPPDGYRTKAGKLKKSKSQKGGGPEWSDVK
ncbi:MAG TPA: hypothetical protein VK165_00320 [Azonexus sp.]|nr:hypothetical protein [Azonexus sp.]